MQRTGVFVQQHIMRRSALYHLLRQSSNEYLQNYNAPPSFSSFQALDSALTYRSYRRFSQTRIVSKNTIKVTYIEADGTEKTVDAEIGQNLMQVAHDSNVELEGACGGELACSTCHLIFEQEIYDTLPEKEEEEEDMLDLAFEVTETSRLGCQILVREDMDGMTVRIPNDGF